MTFNAQHAAAAKQAYKEPTEPGEPKRPDIWEAGWYPAVVKDVEDGLTPKKGGQMMKVTFNVRDRENGGKKEARQWFCYEHPNPIAEALANERIGQIIHATGVEMPTDWEGEKLMLMLTEPTAEMNAAGYYNDNEVRGYKAFEKVDPANPPAEAEPEDDGVPF